MLCPSVVSFPYIELAMCTPDLSEVHEISFLPSCSISSCKSVIRPSQLFISTWPKDLINRMFSLSIMFWQEGISIHRVYQSTIVYMSFRACSPRRHSSKTSFSLHSYLMPSSQLEQMLDFLQYYDPQALWQEKILSTLRYFWSMILTPFRVLCRSPSLNTCLIFSKIWPPRLVTREDNTSAQILLVNDSHPECLLSRWKLPDPHNHQYNIHNLVFKMLSRDLSRKWKHPTWCGVSY